jgi:hypothetical protein
MSFSIKRNKNISGPASDQNSEKKQDYMESLFGTDPSEFFKNKQDEKGQNTQGSKKVPGSEKGLCITNGKMAGIDQM